MDPLALGASLAMNNNTTTSSSDIYKANYNDLRKLQLYRLQQNGNNPRVFSINDYKWSEQNNLNFADPNNVQKIILEEFQPDPIFDIGRFIDVLFGRISKSVEGEKTTTTTEFSILGRVVGSTISSAIQSGLSYGAEKAIMSSYLSNPQQAIKFPIDLIKRMFPGRFLNRYELPFFEKNYLDTTNSGTWSTQGSSRVLGTALHKIFQENMNLDFPTAPTWTCGDNKGKDFKFDLYLINDNSDALVKNFRFLHSLISGTFWLQLSVLQKSPNIYRVTVPGRFVKYFCAIGINSEMVGKLRTNPDAASILNNNNFSAIKENTLFPDAYKLEIQVQDLTPNHFNNYINYLMEGDNTVAIGEQVVRAGALEVVSEMSVQGKEAGIQAANIAKEQYDNISQLSKKFLGAKL